MATLTVGPGKSYSTINSALAAARTGTVNDFDVIEVYDDTYNETIQTGSIDWVTIRAAPGNDPVINRGNASSIAFHKQNTTGEWNVEGFTLLNFNNGGTNAVFQGSSPNGSSVSVRDCMVIGANRLFANMKGATIGESIIVERNFLSGAAAFINLGDQVIFRNNIVKDITAATQVFNTETAGTIQFTNNLIATTTTQSIGLRGYTSDNFQQNLEFKNNIIVNYSDTNRGTTGVQTNWPYASNNLVIGAFDSATSQTHTGTLTETLENINDVFYDWDAFIAANITDRTSLVSAVRNLELATGSIAINAASSGTLFTNTLDFFERSRLIDAAGTIYEATSSWYSADGGKTQFGIPEFESNDQFTISCWVQPRSIQNTGIGTMWLIGEDDTDESSLTHRTFDSDVDVGDQLVFTQIFSTNNGQWKTGAHTMSSRLSANRWHHVVVTYDKSSPANNPKIYLNNVDMSLTENITPAGTRATNTFQTASLFANELGNHQFDSYMRDWSYWSKELSAAEVAELWNGGTPLPLDETLHSADANLVLYIPFDDTTEEEKAGRAVITSGIGYFTQSAPMPEMSLGPLRFYPEVASVSTPATRTTRRRLLISRRHPQAGTFTRIYPVHRRL